MIAFLRRTVGLTALVPAALWAWRERHLLAGMAQFATTVPARMRLGRSGEVVLAAKANLALLREPRLRGADVQLDAVQAGEVVLRAGPGAEAQAELARGVLDGVPGVLSVRVESSQAHVAPSSGASSPTVVAGSGTVESPDGDAEAPIRI